MGRILIRSRNSDKSGNKYTEITNVDDDELDAIVSFHDAFCENLVHKYSMVIETNFVNDKLCQEIMSVGDGVYRECFEISFTIRK